jgi:hypothetical protein
MEEITLAIAMVIGLTEAIKRTRLINNRYTPIISLALGLAIALLMNGLSADAIFSGIIVGLSASGLFSGTKKVALDK